MVEQKMGIICERQTDRHSAEESEVKHHTYIHVIIVINIMTQILCDWTDDIKATSVTTIQVETALDDH